jgi:hypothetical protein
MITVVQNAYLKKAEEHENFSNIHRNILFVLIHEKKHYSKEELLCFTQNNQVLLDNALNDLEELGLIYCEGWLIRLSNFEDLNREICEELAERE